MGRAFDAVYSRLSSPLGPGGRRSRSPRRRPRHGRPLHGPAAHHAGRGVAGRDGDRPVGKRAHPSVAAALGVLGRLAEVDRVQGIVRPCRAGRSWTAAPTPAGRSASPNTRRVSAAPASVTQAPTCRARPPVVGEQLVPGAAPAAGEPRRSVLRDYGVRAADLRLVDRPSAARSRRPGRSRRSSAPRAPAPAPRPGSGRGRRRSSAGRCGVDGHGRQLQVVAGIRHHHPDVAAGAPSCWRHLPPARLVVGSPKSSSTWFGSPTTCTSSAGGVAQDPLRVVPPHLVQVEAAADRSRRRPPAASSLPSADVGADRQQGFGAAPISIRSRTTLASRCQPADGALAAGWDAGSAEQATAGRGPVQPARCSRLGAAGATAPSRHTSASPVRQRCG